MDLPFLPIGSHSCCGAGVPWISGLPLRRVVSPAGAAPRDPTQPDPLSSWPAAPQHDSCFPLATAQVWGSA